MINPERYRQIDELFRAALEVDPDRRLEFINKACSGDQSLLAEVEALVASASGEWSLIDQPAPEIAAHFLPEQRPDLSVGESLGHYKILALLGVGGMGQVYLAEDLRLGRRVALKLLPREFTKNEARLHRFQQEARAASSLNHPSILTIHDVVDIEGRHLIATEFIDGETLRQRLKSGPLTLRETLEIAIQIAGALSAAHQAHIIHRDIKPENIMLRRDGYVKVLDFGLAKLAGQHESNTDAGESDRPDISSGLVMGTAKYMSPEQVRSLDVDQRSDLFSLGILLYEMLTGRTPFNGDDGGQLMNSILTDEPSPLAPCLPDATVGLQRLVNKSLRKERAERYQTAEEMLVDLRSALKEKRTSVLTRAARHFAQHKVAASLLLIVFALIAAAGSFGIYRSFKVRTQRFQNIIVTKFTNFGDASNPSISPDGRNVVYAKGWGTEGPGKFSLWRRAVDTGTEMQIVPPTEIDGWIGPTAFSPDGNYIRYWVRLRNQPMSMYEVPLNGGGPRKLTLPSTSFSPDGKRLAYLDNRLAEGKTVLVVADSDGTNEREIITRQAPNYYRTAIKPAWSPNGKLIACVGQNGNESYARVLAIDIEKGTETSITREKWTAFRSFAWLPDMSGLLIAAAGETSSIYQIWHISYPEGIARRVTNDTVSYFDLDLAADGKTLVATKVDSPTQFWVVPVKAIPSTAAGGNALYDTNNARQINTATIGSGENKGLGWTPDGRIVYVSEESGNADIWSMNADGSDQKQLTTDPHRDANLDVSPDGRYIAFISERAGSENIWIMNVDGSNQRKLTSKSIDRFPVFSADSKWVYFNSWETGKATIWKVSVEGGELIQVISELSFSPAISPDGKLLAYTGASKTFVAPSEGGPPIKSFDARNNYRWTPDGRALTFTCINCKHNPDWPDIWTQPLDGGAPQQLTNFRLTYIFMYAWSRDGKQLAIATHTSPSDLVLISDVK